MESSNSNTHFDGTDFAFFIIRTLDSGYQRYNLHETSSRMQNTVHNSQFRQSGCIHRKWSNNKGATQTKYQQIAIVEDEDRTHTSTHTRADQIKTTNKTN